ncbi:hypothetical protein FA13DRAFT_1730692 [Coprinellus micaceus]|uniref:Uncharacterized protein n=1 Tax=Coprinellus micaceus TaxID=71717 RepID=A0A4Y7THI6_COPMI|nr:hypothetical protein FA13DRAFT_1730692 [Coprinellus micaceus]
MHLGVMRNNLAPLTRVGSLAWGKNESLHERFIVIDLYATARTFLLHHPFTHSYASILLDTKASHHGPQLEVTIPKMTKIWGFDLAEMHWGAFKNEQMFDRRWHLRKQRFIVYQLAMLTGLAAECTATYSLSKYNSHQDHIEEASGHTVSEYNEDLIRSAICTIVFCVFVATLYGADFFFLVFWPRRMFPNWYHQTKKGRCGSDHIGCIVIATREAYLIGAAPAVAAQLIQQFARPPLRYRSWAQNIAWVVLVWIAFVFTAASTYLMFKASAYDQRVGTEPFDDEQLTPPPERSRKSLAQNSFSSGAEKV